MSDSASSSSCLDPNLVETLRREVASAELQVYELKDRMLVVNTDRADAVALLGQAELLLEQKINYIITLDEALNRRIRELENEVGLKTTEIDQRDIRIAEVENLQKQETAAHNATISVLSERLEEANQATNQAHKLAYDIDQKRGAFAQELSQTSTRLSDTERALAQSQATLAELQSELNAAETQLSKLSSLLPETQTALGKTEQLLQCESDRVAQIQSSLLWRICRPWRALFGPKL